MKINALYFLYRALFFYSFTKRRGQRGQKAAEPFQSCCVSGANPGSRMRCTRPISWPESTTVKRE